LEIRAVSLFTSEASPPRCNCRVITLSIRSLIGLAVFRPVQTIQCSTP